jgi:hypothetical protein
MRRHKSASASNSREALSEQQPNNKLRREENPWCNGLLWITFLGNFEHKLRQSTDAVPS